MKATIIQLSLLLLCCCCQSSWSFTLHHSRVNRQPTATTTTAILASSVTGEELDATTAKNTLPKVLETSTTTTIPGDNSDNDDDADALLDTHKVWVRTIKSFLFDVLYSGKTIDRSYARFYALETIARMPYFSYLSVLHLLETLGQWRQADRLALHFAESWNEMHHLLVMEHLLTQGTPQTVAFRDRFIAQHVAVFYYWFAVALYMWQPSTAYSLNQAVEEEAYETYDAFLNTHGEYLKTQPAPKVAVEYYTGKGKDLFERMHLERTARPNVKCDNLFDCFMAIRDDELEHSQTMAFLKRQPDNEDLPSLDSK